MASSVVDIFTGANKGNSERPPSECGDRDSLDGNIQAELHFNQSEKKGASNYFNKKREQSFRSGSGGSVITSMSDLERIERIMTQA